MRLARIGLSLAVAFWMAGAGCLLGCENMVSAAVDPVAAEPAPSQNVIVSGDACASASHDCCAKRHAKSAHKAPPSSRSTDALIPEVVANTSSSPIDCPLAVTATAALSKSDPDRISGAVLVPRENNPFTSQPEQRSALSHPLRLPNRGHTYLRCCVFLI